MSLFNLFKKNRKVKEDLSNSPKKVDEKIDSSKKTVENKNTEKKASKPKNQDLKPTKKDVKEKVSTEKKITVTSGSFIDQRDGKEYKTVKIGKQTWFAENLAFKVQPDYSKQKYGSVTYNNDEALGKVYGQLYDVDEAIEACPSGWHLPSENDWDTLIDYLGGDKIAGGKLKEKGFEHWESPNEGATNESGFTALPGGSRGNSNFMELGTTGKWWSKSEVTGNSNYIWSYKIYSSSSEVSKQNVHWSAKFSVRCIKG